MLILLFASLILVFGTGECFAARRVGICIVLIVLGYWSVQLVELLAGIVSSAAFGHAVQDSVKTLDAAVVCIGDGIAYVLKCIVCFIFLFFFMMSYGFLCLFFGRK